MFFEIVEEVYFEHSEKAITRLIRNNCQENTFMHTFAHCFQRTHLCHGCSNFPVTKGSTAINFSGVTTSSIPEFDLYVRQIKGDAIKYYIEGSLDLQCP